MKDFKKIVSDRKKKLTDSLVKGVSGSYYPYQFFEWLNLNCKYLGGWWYKYDGYYFSQESIYEFWLANIMK